MRIRTLIAVSFILCLLVSCKSHESWDGTYELVVSGGSPNSNLMNQGPSSLVVINEGNSELTFLGSPMKIVKISPTRITAMGKGSVLELTGRLGGGKVSGDGVVFQFVRENESVFALNESGKRVLEYRRIPD